MPITTPEMWPASRGARGSIRVIARRTLTKRIKNLVIRRTSFFAKLLIVGASYVRRIISGASRTLGIHGS